MTPAVYVRLADDGFPPEARLVAAEGVERVLGNLLSEAFPIEWPHVGRTLPPLREWVSVYFCEGSPGEGGGWGLRLRLAPLRLSSWLEPIARAEQAAALSSSRPGLATLVVSRLAGVSIADLDAAARARAIEAWTQEVGCFLLSGLADRLRGHIGHGAVPVLYARRPRPAFTLFPR